jgi:hypothetical protein
MKTNEYYNIWKYYIKYFLLDNSPKNVLLKFDRLQSTLKLIKEDNESLPTQNDKNYV